MIIKVEFDTKEKMLNVTMDDKKVDNVSEIMFMNFGDISNVELRTVSSSDEDQMVTITKILANEDGEDIIEVSQPNSLVDDLQKALFSNKR